MSYKDQIKIIIFTYNNKPPKLPDISDIKYRHVNFESTKLDDLLLIAKYRILDFPTSIIIDNNERILLKIKGTIPNSYINNILSVK